MLLCCCPSLTGRAARFLCLSVGLFSACSLPLAPDESTARQTAQVEVADWYRARDAGTPDSPRATVRSPVTGTPDSPRATVRSPVTSEQITSQATVQVDAREILLVTLLHGLARQAGLELVLHETPVGTVTLRSHDRTLEHVLDRLSMQVPFRWRVGEGTLQVWSGGPHVASYAVDYLNLERSLDASVGLATQVGSFSTDMQGSGSDGSNNSRTLIASRSEHRFWARLQAVLEPLLGEDSRLMINPEAGLVTLDATVREHQAVRTYLHRVNASAHRQVRIEATVAEVTLSDEYDAGVDWRILAQGEQGISAAQNFGNLPTLGADSAFTAGAPQALFSLVRQSGVFGNISATLQLLESFGDVRILSRPQIIALNNQPSVLKVVDNRVYFTVDVERQQREDSDEIITRSQIHTVPVGLVMNVIPYISGQGDILLNVRPTLSRILGFVNDPNPALAGSGISNGVPEIQVREMESMLRLRSGELAIIGGLMQEASDNSDRQLPGLARIPLLGRLFRREQRRKRTTELLILLRPTLEDDSSLQAQAELSRLMR